MVFSLGEPSPAALERDIAREGGILGEDIARRGQRGGTAEAQRRGAFAEASLIARESARNAEIAQRGQQFSQFQIVQSNLLSQRLAQLRGESLGAIPLIQAGATALQPSLQQQQLGFQSNLVGAQGRQSLFGGLGELGGTLLSSPLEGTALGKIF